MRPIIHPLALLVGPALIAACHPAATLSPSSPAPTTAPSSAPIPVPAPAPGSDSSPALTATPGPNSSPAPIAAPAQATKAVPTSRAPTGAAPSPPTIARSAACSNDPEAALARGRKLAAAGKWAEAVLAYDPGVHRSPGHAVLRGERGYALYKAGLYTEAAGELEVALGLTDARSLKSAIYFNIALVHAALGNEEAARSYLSSSSERGNAAARKRLGDASRCRATSKPKPDAQPAPLASNLRELVAKRQFVYCPDPPKVTSEAQAEALLCRGCGGGSWEDGGCSLSFPLAANDGYMHLHSFQFRAEEVPNRKYRYIYFNSMLDSIAEAKNPVWKVVSRYLVIETFGIDWHELDDGVGHPVFAANAPVYTVNDMADPSAATTDCSPDVGSAEGNMSHGGGALWGFGVPWRRTHTVTVYSMATRAPLLEVQAEDGELGWKIRGTELDFTGAGCRETVAIPEG